MPSSKLARAARSIDHAMAIGEKDSDATVPDRVAPKLVGDEPPPAHELKPDETQPTRELRWTQSVIRGGRKRATRRD